MSVAQRFSAVAAAIDAADLTRVATTTHPPVIRYLVADANDIHGDFEGAPRPA